VCGAHHERARSGPRQACHVGYLSFPHKVRGKQMGLKGPDQNFTVHSLNVKTVMQGHGLE
jgi:hypothetical protein